MSNALLKANIHGWRNVDVGYVPMLYVRDELRAAGKLSERDFILADVRTVLAKLTERELGPLRKWGRQHRTSIPVAFDRDLMSSLPDDTSGRIPGVIRLGTQGIKGIGGIPLFDEPTLDEAISGIKTAVAIFMMERSEDVAEKMNFQDVEREIDLPFFWQQMGMMIRTMENERMRLFETGPSTSDAKIPGLEIWRIRELLSPMIEHLINSSSDHAVHDFVRLLIEPDKAGLEYHKLLQIAYRNATSRRLFSNSLWALLVNGCGRKLKADLLSEALQPEMTRCFGVGRMESVLIGLMKQTSGRTAVEQFFREINPLFSSEMIASRCRSAGTSADQSGDQIMRRIYIFAKTEPECVFSAEEISIIIGEKPDTVRKTLIKMTGIGLLKEVFAGHYKVASN